MCHVQAGPYQFGCLLCIRIVDQAIKLALQQRPSPLSTVHPGPTNQDIFYSNVSSVDDILPALISQQDSMLHALGSPQERLQVVLNVAAIIEAMIHDAIQYRHSQSVSYQPCLSTDSPEVEFIPWTGMLSFIRGGGSDEVRIVT